MFKVKTNEEIGEYLDKLIYDNGFESMRQFGKAYLELADRIVNDEELRKMSNRLSQIKQGKKAIQTYDLPYFTHLLHVSAEEILSAGLTKVPISDRITNYQFANSKDKSLWEEYINRDDRIILNTDEYGKTIIEYALEFGNYELLKYMCDKKYIWFVGEKYDDLTFGAGTKIKRKEHYEIDVMETKLRYEDNFRVEMIKLAIDNKDYKMLDELHAREIPVYHVNGYNTLELIKKCDNSHKALIDSIANSDDEVIDYFTTDFYVTNSVDKGDLRLNVMYPYINELLVELIETKNHNVEKILNKCIARNKGIYDYVKEIYIKYAKNLANENNYDYDLAKEYAYNDLKWRINFNGNTNILIVNAPYVNKYTETNIINLDCKGNSKKVQNLIDEVNMWFDKIVNFEY